MSKAQSVELTDSLMENAAEWERMHNKKHSFAMLIEWQAKKRRHRRKGAWPKET